MKKLDHNIIVKVLDGITFTHGGCEYFEITMKFLDNGDLDNFTKISKILREQRAFGKMQLRFKGAKKDRFKIIFLFYAYKNVSSCRND